MITFMVNGIEVSPSDFPKDLRGWVAYSVAFIANTHCSDKEAMLELYLHEADSIITRIQSETPLPESIQQALNSGDGVYRP